MRKLVISRWHACKRALDEFEIEGVTTTASLHKRLARLSEVQARRVRYRIFGAAADGLIAAMAA